MVVQEESIRRGESVAIPDPTRVFQILNCLHDITPVLVRQKFVNFFHKQTETRSLLVFVMNDDSS